MATLEKIRSKSVLLLVIIGAALLAFIIGDFFNSSRQIFGPDYSIAKIDGDKIEHAEFQSRSEAMTRNISASTDEERAFLDQQVLTQLVLEKLRDEEYSKLGITVTDQELNDAVNGSNSLVGNLMAMQMTNGQIQSAADFYDLTNNPAKYGYPEEQGEQMRQMWMNFENALSNQLAENKFASMLAGTLTANKLDVAQMVSDEHTGYMISYVSKPYSNDASIAVTDEEIQKEWEAEKSQYKLSEPARLINVISVPIVPSVEDETAAKALIDEVVAGLATTPDLDALRGRKGFDSQRTVLTNEAIAEAVRNGGNARLKSFADSAAVGSAAVVSDSPTQFQIAKLFGRGLESDSLTFNVVVYEAANTAAADSIKAALAAGAKAADLNKIEGVQLALDSISTSLTNPTFRIPQLGDLLTTEFRSYKDSFLNARLGEPFRADTIGNGNGLAMLYTVTSRKAPQSNVDLALISYTLLPSETTINNLRDNLRKYIAENATADKFAANAAASNYSSNFSEVSASAPYITIGQDRQGNPVFLPNSHHAAAWALEAEKGAVSPIFGDERTGSFLVASLNEVFDEYRTPADPAVKSYLTQKIRNSKNGDAMMAEYKGKATDLNGYATLFGSEVASDAINIQSGARYGADLVAQIMTTPQGTLAGPAKGNNGVVVYQVTAVNNPVRTANMTTDADIYNARRGAGALMNGNILFRLFLGDRKFENRITKVIKRD